MAQQTQILLIDDLDGTPASETVSFTLDGVNYEIDLNEDNAAKFRKEMGTYISKARKVGGRRRRGRGAAKATRSSETQAMREWAKAKGYKVSDRGRIPADIQKEYREANK